MSMKRVTVMPGEHQFEASDKQDLLQAALGAGINLSHGCTNGQCGRCIAHLVEGEISRLGHADYPLGELQREQGYFLTCCHGARSDLRIEVATVSSAQQVPEQHIATRVYRLKPLSDEVMSVTLKTPRTAVLEFLAGQYMTLDLGHGLQRNKSLASCPCNGLKPEFHVRRRAGDHFSEYVFQQLRKNDRVTITGPYGDFIATEDERLPLLLIAFDTGFASIKSLLEHFIAQQRETPIRLFWLTSGSDKPYMYNYCRSLHDALDNFEFTRVLSVAENFGAVTRVLGSILHRTEQRQPHIVYVTVPHQCMDKAQHWFLQQGVAPQRLHLDRVEWFGADDDRQCAWQDR